MPEGLFSSWSLGLNLLAFAMLAGVIWLAGTRLSYSLDAIAEKTHVARAFMGLILLATATGLPELVTTLTAAAGGNGSLALNNMFGGMMLQLAVLAVADMFVRKGTLTAHPEQATVAVAGLLSIVALTTMLVIDMIGDRAVAGHVGLGGLVMGGGYIGAMLILRQVQARHVWSPVDMPDKAREKDGRENRFDELAIGRLVLYAVLSAIVIFISGALLVRLAETLAGQTGWGTSFVGASLLAMTTSMPELSTAIAAVRVKAYTMAISNILGSNLIMTFLVMPVDVAYTAGPVLNEMDDVARFGLLAGILMTAVYAVGLITRPRIKLLGMGMDSLVVLVLYGAAIAGLYHLR